MPKDAVLSILTDDGLNARERKFCHSYLINELDIRKTTRELGGNLRTYDRYLVKQHVRAYLKKRVDELEEKFGEDLEVLFSDKIRKLKHICDICFPDWAGSENLKELRPDSAINAIKEMNKMQGHYAPEKHVVESKDDVKVVTEILDELNRKYKMEY